MNSTLGNLKATLLLASMLICFSTTTRANTVTLEYLLDGGSVTSGDLLFSGFNTFSQVGALSVSATNIWVTTTSSGILFQSSDWRLYGINKSYDMCLTFSVTALDNQSITGNSFTTTGAYTGEGNANLVETVFAANNTNTTLASELIYLNNPDTGKTSLSAAGAFAAQSTILVKKDFSMTTGADADNNAVVVSDFTQNFTTTVITTVPEPTMMALATLGGASLLLFRRRK
jgi:hypothetical protein